VERLNQATPMKTLAPCDHDECPPIRCIQNANAKGVGFGDGLGASVQYDQSTKLIIMGCLCHMDNIVNVGKVESVATEIMAVMSRRRKPNKAWGVTVSIAPNS
jgi:hypothetical protein